MIRVAIYSPTYHAQIELAAGQSMEVHRATGETDDHLQWAHSDSRGTPVLRLTASNSQTGPRLTITPLTAAPGSDPLLSGRRSRIKTLALPACYRCGASWLVAAATQDDQQEVARLRQIAEEGPTNRTSSVDFSLLSRPPASSTLTRWFQKLSELQRSCIGSPEFFAQAARAICDPGGFEAGLVLLRDQKHWGLAAERTEPACGEASGRSTSPWQIAASHLLHPPTGVTFNRLLMDRVAHDGVTHYHEPPTTNPRRVTTGMTADMSEHVVVAPIWNAAQQVAGAMVAIRAIHADNRRRGVRPLEALWVQLVAETMSAALTRLEAEAEAVRTRVLLQQTFTPSLAEKLANQPQLLRGRQQEITLLFADLRSSSESLDRDNPTGTCAELARMVEMLSDCVLDHDGVIVDFYGDGLVAMWNAPTDQANHTELAARAAVAMQNRAAEFLGDAAYPATDTLSSLPRNGDGPTPSSLGPLVQPRLAIGIHTGRALVGNAGSRRRVKYGPRGAAVHLASRLETASKRMNVGIVLSAAARRNLPHSAVVRRIGRAQLKGFAEPIELFELTAFTQQALEHSVLHRLQLYEQALSHCEHGDLSAAEGLLEELQQQTGPDAAAVFLQSEIQSRRDVQPLPDGREFVMHFA